MSRISSFCEKMRTTQIDDCASGGLLAWLKTCCVYDIMENAGFPNLKLNIQGRSHKIQLNAYLVAIDQQWVSNTDDDAMHQVAEKICIDLEKRLDCYLEMKNKFMCGQVNRRDYNRFMKCFREGLEDDDLNSMK